MSVITPTAAERARERIRRFGEQQPDALRLARYASLAVRVDAALLRALRQRLLPGTDAGIEADLWFSMLTESVSSQGFVLDGDVVAQLREELADERVNGKQRALTEAARITAEAHRHWPESLRLEEHATALALRTPDAGAAVPPGEDLEALLRGLVKAMAESQQRGMEVARWAQRALVRLPKAARETEAALLLALGAAERLGTSIRFTDDDRPGRLPGSAAWMLPSGSFARWITIGLRRFDDGLEFIEPDNQSPELRLPDTSPLFVEIGWRVGAEHHHQTVSVSTGRTVQIPREARDIQFRSLAGEEFALESIESESPAESPDEPAKTDTPAGSLELAVVTVEPHASGLNRSAARGFFVAPDTVITVGNGGSLPAGLTCTVRWRGRTMTGSVTAEQAPFRPVLVRLQEAVPEATLLPRRIHGITTVDVPWRSDVDDAGEISGAIVGLGIDWQRPDGERVRDVFELSSDAHGSRAGWVGAPVVVDGDVVAMIVSATPERVLALPWEAIEPFIVQNLHSDDAGNPDDVARSIVTVEINAPRPHHAYATGFFVTPTLVVTSWESAPPDIGSTSTLHWRDQAFQAAVIAEERGTVLFRVSSSLPGVSVLGRRFDAAASMINRQWRTADNNHGEITGTFVRTDAEWHAPDGALEHVFELRTEIGAQGLWSGAPVVVDGWAVGQIVSVQGERIFARPITVLEPFLVANIRPAEHDPVVFVSYAYRDEYGKGAEIDDAQIERVMNALRVARVNPWLDTTFKESDQLIQAVNASEGGVIMLTPVSHLDTGPARIELLALAFRRWAQPDFPVAEFRFRRATLPPETPGPLAVLPGVDLDDDSDAHLAGYARRTFARLGRAPDEQGAVTATRARLIAILKKAIPEERAEQQADVIVTSGESGPWPSWLSGLSAEDLRELSETACAFSFSPEAARPLRTVALGDGAGRAFCLSSSVPQVAQAVIRRAWLGTTPPLSIVIADQSSRKVEQVRDAVLGSVSEALSCTSSEASFLLERVTATIFVILVGPVPGPEAIERLLTTMPSAAFLFLVGDGTNPYPTLVANLQVPAGVDQLFDNPERPVSDVGTRESEAPSREAPPPSGPVFISSASVNPAEAARLERALKAGGLPVQLDNERLDLEGLLYRGLQDAIRDSRAVVLVWSRSAARSRWVSVEVLAAFHLDRFILPCVTDDAALPSFLRDMVYLDLRVTGDQGVNRLVRAVTEAPAHRNPVGPVAPPGAEVSETVETLARLQQDVLERLTSSGPSKAADTQRRLDSEMARAEQRWPSERAILTLAGYHRKNAYMVKHWDAIQAGQPPDDPLLLDAERRFFDAAFVDPDDLSVLNGLASVFIFKRELDAAAFFNQRTLELAKQANVPYPEAEHDRELIASLGRQAVPRAPGTTRPTRRRSVATSSKAERAAKTTRKMAPKKK